MEDISQLKPAEEYKVVDLSPLRKVIAARMVESTQTIPHARVGRDICLDELYILRKQLLNDYPKEKLSVNDFVVKACAIALKSMPQFNIQFVDNQIHQYQHPNIALVIAVNGGLSTPVIFNASGKNIWEIAKHSKELANLAHTGRLKMSDISGGTFSISNLGMHGIDQFDAIINPPQGAILAVGSACSSAIVRDGQIVIAKIMRITLSMDHRAFDGVEGAQFISLVKELLEQPSKLME